MNGLRPTHFMGVGSCLQRIANSSSHGSFGDCVGERNYNLTMIWKCSSRFQEVKFLESLKTQYVVFVLQESLWVAQGWGGVGGWEVTFQVVVTLPVGCHLALDLTPPVSEEMLLLIFVVPAWICH